MPQMNAWQSVRYYDPSTDAVCVRISGFSGRGEFWCKRPLPAPGRARRLMVDEALSLIQQAIEAGLEPGEVTTDN